MGVLVLVLFMGFVVVWINLKRIEELLNEFNNIMLIIVNKIIIFILLIFIVIIFVIFVYEGSIIK